LSAAPPAGEPRPIVARLKRDLGVLEAYAALIGVLVGAGIFRVTSEAFAATGPSVILGHVVLAPLVFATSIAYAVLLSTPLGRGPGGEYTHLRQIFGSRALGFAAAWLKLISYIAATAFLAHALADYLAELARLCGLELDTARWHEPLAIASLFFFLVVHVSGARWFGRLQVAMCTVLGVSIVVLVLPGLFAVRTENYTPFFTHGAGGFASALPGLFFAYAGFETLAHTAGEVEDSTRRLPRVFLKGLLITFAIFVSMSLVAFGVLPGAELAESPAPMARVGQVYLPWGAAALVTVGGVMAVATSLNATLFGPARILLMLARDGLAPPIFGHVHAERGTPILGLCTTCALAVALLLSGQLSLALNIAVFALVIVYAAHSLGLLLLPWRRPDLEAQAQVRLSRATRTLAATLSIAGMAALILVQLIADANVIEQTTWIERYRQGRSTALELVLFWGILGTLTYALTKRTKT
jgi:amino acid transporter